LGFLFGYIFFGTPSVTMNGILIGSFILILTGIADDIKSLGAKEKFICQIVATLVVVFYGNLVMKNIDAFGFYIEFDWLAYPLTILFILGTINCINLIDGLDGLAGGISSIYFLTIGIIATFQGKFGLDFILAFIMLGSTLGFLLHNFNPATIFMGDSGSMFLGFIISVIALLGFKNVTMTSLIIPLLILIIPILDTLFAIIRRALKGENVMTHADQLHIHHQFLARGFSQKQTVLIIYIITLLFAGASIVYVIKGVTVGFIVYGFITLLVLIFVTRTNVVFDHKAKGKRKEKIKI
jgi:UDP-GlcNAc:undecaprenyl-phosphate GlcNAc-1-phosphate transferase